MMTTTGYASADFNAGTTVAADARRGRCSSAAPPARPPAQSRSYGTCCRPDPAARARPDRAPGGRQPVRLNGAGVDERDPPGDSRFVLLYIGLFVLGDVCSRSTPPRRRSTSRVLDAIGGVGDHARQRRAGVRLRRADGSFDPFSDFSKPVMIVLMWLGRLEFIPMQCSSPPRTGGSDPSPRGHDECLTLVGVSKRTRP